MQRHDLVWLTREGWDVLQNHHVENREILTFWRDRGFPAIVRRCEMVRITDRIPIGIALPPAMGKKRLALSSDIKYIKETSKPLDLIKIFSFSPKRWQKTLSMMMMEKMEIRVYGSLAWQALTQLNYVQANSDIDLLIDIITPGQLTKAMNLLNHYNRFLPLDGELIFPNGSAVSWKEMCDQKETILVKSLNSASLMDKESLMEVFST